MAVIGLFSRNIFQLFYIWPASRKDVSETTKYVLLVFVKSCVYFDNPLSLSKIINLKFGHFRTFTDTTPFSSGLQNSNSSH